MSFDLGDALRRKGEFETARLDDFEFRVRARTMRLIAEHLGIDPVPVIAAIAHHDDTHILAGLPGAGAAYANLQAEARRQLVAELGDPAAHRLA